MVEFQTFWGWQPALYLFLGGTGAGALVYAGVLTILDRKRHDVIIGVSQWAAAACMAVGLLLLLSELTNPALGIMAWESFVNPSSWMTWGAWGVLAAIAVAAIAALCTMRTTASGIAALWRGFKGVRPALCKVLAVLGIILGLFVAVYTGILLMSAPGIPFWNTPLLPLLFTASALDTGVALVEIVSLVVAKRQRMAKKCTALLEKSVVVLVVVEAVLLTALILTAGGGTGAAAEAAAASAAAITVGANAPYFWCLVVLCGLAAPLATSVIAMRMSGRDVSVIVATGAASALVGGCALRFVVLMSGAHANMVLETVSLVLA